MELSVCRTRVYEDAFLTDDTLSLFRYRFPPGATPHNASGMASLGASSIKISSPSLFDELTLKKRINEQQNTSVGQNQGLAWSFDPSLWGNQQLTNRIQVLDRTKALYDPRTQASGETNYLQNTTQVLDRTKALYGPRTQASGETNYLQNTTQVLDRTKALHGPRTQASGETNGLKGKTGLHGFSSLPSDLQH